MYVPMTDQNVRQNIHVRTDDRQNVRQYIHVRTDDRQNVQQELRHTGCCHRRRIKVNRHTSTK